MESKTAFKLTMHIINIDFISYNMYVCFPSYFLGGRGGGWGWGQWVKPSNWSGGTVYVTCNQITTSIYKCMYTTIHMFPIILICPRFLRALTYHAN